MTKAHIPASNLRLKRAYAPADAGDGTRILIDRLWPRGISKQRAALDEWLKEIAPSPGLRQWFAHEPAKWPEFQRRYKAELLGHAMEIERLRGIAAKGVLTLVYGARDQEHNDAVVLRDVLLHERRNSQPA